MKSTPETLQAERLQDIRKQLSDIERELATIINKRQKPVKANKRESLTAKYLNKLG